jgi:cytochrome P450
MKSEQIASRKIAPGPKGVPILGMLPAASRDRLQMCLDLADMGDVVRFKMGPYLIHFLSDPASAHHVLVDNHKNYDKQWQGYQKLGRAIGDGLLVSNGEFWLRQRRIAQPAFHRDRIAAFADIMARKAERTAERWREHATRGEPVEVADEMMRVTLDIIAQTMLSRDIDNDADRIGHAFGWLVRAVGERITRLVEIPLSIPTPENRRFNAQVRTIDALVYGIIAERRRTGADNGDLLSLLMAARDEDSGEGMSDQQLRDEIMTMFLAGHETTANALTWTFYFLAKNPASGRLLEEELRRELGGRTPAYADLPRLAYTRMVLDEAMRLYPPVWIVARRVIADDEIGGFHIPAGSFVFVCPYVTHRHASAWENAEGFDPQRFAANAAALPKGAYIPFGAGPRGCMGRMFSLVEAQLVLATLWQRYRLDLVPTRPVRVEASLTLRPRDGLFMTLHERRIT